MNTSENPTENKTIPLLYRWILCLFIFILLQIPIIASNAAVTLTAEEQEWIKENPIIRIGCPTGFPPLIYIENNKLTGLSVDFNNEICKKTGLTIELIPLKTEEVWEQLQTKKIDGLFPAVLGLKRFKHDYNWTQKCFSAYAYAFTRDNSLIKVGSTADLKKYTIGLRTGVNHLAELAEEGNVTKIFYPTKEALIVALLSGEVDVALGNIDLMYEITDKTISVKLAHVFTDHPIEVGYSLRKDFPLLQSIIDKGIKSISSRKINELKAKWLVNHIQEEVHLNSFTDDELRWIKNNPEIKFHLDDNSPPFQYESQSGSIQGITPDLLLVLENHTGIKFTPVVHSQKEYVNRGNMKEASIFGMWPRFASASIPDYTPTLTIASGYLSLFGNPDLQITSYKDLIDSRIVCVAATNNRLPKLFSSQNTIIDVESTEEAISYLLSDKADYMLEFSEVAKYHLKKNQVSSIKECYTYKVPDEAVFMVKNNQPLLLSIINKSLSVLEHTDVSAVLNKWYTAESKKSGINLTDKERSWLKNHPVIQIASDNNWAPVEWSDEKGQFHGLSMGYLREIERLLGIQFISQQNSLWSDLLEKGKKKEIDGFSCMAKTDERAKYFNFTLPYSSFPIKLFVRSDAGFITNLSMLNGKRVAVGKGFATEDFLRRDYPKIKLVTVPGPTAGLEAVRDGRADAFMDNFLTTGHTISKQNFRDIKVGGDTPYSYNQSISIRNDWPEFIPILQKALDAIPEYRKQQIYNQWLPITVEVPRDYSLIWKIVIPFLILVITVLLWNRTLKRKVSQQVETIVKSEHDRIRVYKELAETRHQYQQLIEGSGDLITSVDKDGCFIFVNHKSVDFYGLEPDECIGRSAFEFIHLDDREATIEWFAEQVKNKVTQAMFENRQQSTGGLVRDICWTCTFYYCDNGLLEHTDAIAHDITERKQVERKLHGQQQFVSSILDNTPGLLYVYNVQGEIIKWNKLHETITGYSPEEIAQKNVSSWFESDPETLERVMKTMQEVLTTGYGEVEADLQIKDGSIIPFHFNATLFEMEGETYFTGIGTDLRERKAAEAMIQQSRDQLRTIIDAMPSMLIGIDDDYSITHWNNQAEITFNIKQEDAVGRIINEVLEDTFNLLPEIELALSQKKVVSTASKMKNKDNLISHLDIVVYPIIGEGTTGAVIRIDDVTEKVKLEKTVIQTEKMMSVGGLAAGMAHEINNPLSVITQGIQNCLRRLDPKLPKNIDAASTYNIDTNDLYKLLEERKIIQFLNGGKDAVERAATIVKNMLMFSRESTTEKNFADLKQLVEHTIELGSTDYDMKKRYDFKFIDIVKEYDADLPLVKVCSNEIEQVLLNLFKNAIQAMETIDDDDYIPQFHVRIAQDDDYLRLEIEDNGPGISEKVKTRVFEPFFTTKPVGEGTGLGLSVSYMIISQNHNGTFQVESEEGKYTKFIIRLPI